MSRKTGDQNLAAGIIDFLFTKTMISPVCQAGECESPIEELFLRALLACSVLRVSGRVLTSGPPEKAKVACKPQQQIESYRVDFAISALTFGGEVRRLVVECDGHDFHERTKEQAARDKSRDRRLQELGYAVFRFSGSEIFNDPFKCALQVWEWAERVSDEGRPHE